MRKVILTIVIKDCVFAFRGLQVATFLIGVCVAVEPKTGVGIIKFTSIED